MELSLWDLSVWKLNVWELNVSPGIALRSVKAPGAGLAADRH
jgi:hypothetical protein